MTGRLRTAAAAIDLACLGLFVIIGRDRHDTSDGVLSFLGVLWPLALGWFVAALAMRLYANPSRPWLRLTGTWAFGITLALVVRGIALGRVPPATFAVVLFVFVAFETFGWRLVARLLRRSAPARA